MKNKFQTKNLLQHGYHPIKKIKVALEGFWFVFAYDYSVTYKVILSLVILTLSFFFRAELDLILILLATGNMLTMEMMNSCIELLCDFHETGYNHKIKVIKDVAAAAAGVSIFVWVLIIGWEAYQIIFF